MTFTQLKANLKTLNYSLKQEFGGYTIESKSGDLIICENLEEVSQEFNILNK